MIRWQTIVSTSVVTACLLLSGFGSAAWSQFRPPFGGELTGLTTFTGQVVCVDCTVEQARDAYPNRFNLYQFNNGREDFVMQITSFLDSSQHHYWQSVAGLADEVTVRGPDQVIAALTEEENLRKPVTVTGILRSTRTFDIGNVRIRG